MPQAQPLGWKALVKGYPWFAGDGKYPIPAYSEFMPPPRLGRRPYGATDTWLFSDDAPFDWCVPEIEEEYELRPGLENIAQHVVQQLLELGENKPANHIAGHRRRNLENNPYWSPAIAARAGTLEHERYVVLLPLALSKTQDDMGRVRWTFFGGSEQGPERAFWKSFYAAPGQEWQPRESLAFISRLLQATYGEKADDAAHLWQSGFRILPSESNPGFPYWQVDPLPSWTQPFIVDSRSSFENVRYLLTFVPFGSLAASVREKYLAGKLHLLPFPGSLVFWGVPIYARLQKQLPFAMQLPLQRVVGRHGGPAGIHVPQSGWLQEPRRDQSDSAIQSELLLNTYRRTNRMNRVHRDEDAVAQSTKIAKIAQTLFSTSLDDLDLYNKPMARNCQLWDENAEFVFDGPAASRQQIQQAVAVVTEGGLFRYRFQFPAMRVGEHEIYWHRPLVAFWSARNKKAELLSDALLGYLTAYHVTAPDLAHPIELMPRLLRRPVHLMALKEFESEHDLYAHQTPLNILRLFDARQQMEQLLPRSFARQLVRAAKDDSLDEWLNLLPKRTSPRREGQQVREAIEPLLRPDPALPASITYDATATVAYEQAYWQDILTLSHGQFVTKDNADVVDDAATQKVVERRQRDLDPLGDYLIARHHQAIAAAGMEGRAQAGDLPFRWQTDFDFKSFCGWRITQEGDGRERNILVVIPGKNRQQAVVMADHYDTAYMEDVYEKERGGSGARVAAAGADDNGSATATLLQAAPIFLKLAREGKLERDVWLLHLTGEEFPSDCLGARHFCQALVEGTLKLHAGDQWVDLANGRVVGVVVMDMIAHNRENAQDIFQIAPGDGPESLRLAYQAHIANAIWNDQTREWNQRPERRGSGSGKRSRDEHTIPETALFPQLAGEVRTSEDPRSALFNTDGQVFSDVGVPVILFMENYDINRAGYHDTKDTMENIDLDYGAAVSAIAIETVARVATRADDEIPWASRRA
ncbi:MAG: M28 family peptidase [Chloroflexota bacterium]|nr:M28 family peptidase [Chloroflexota bacterium]